MPSIGRFGALAVGMALFTAAAWLLFYRREIWDSGDLVFLQALLLQALAGAVGFFFAMRELRQSSRQRAEPESALAIAGRMQRQTELRLAIGLSMALELFLVGSWVILPIGLFALQPIAMLVELMLVVILTGMLQRRAMWAMMGGAFVAIFLQTLALVHAIIQAIALSD